MIKLDSRNPASPTNFKPLLDIISHSFVEQILDNKMR